MFLIFLSSLPRKVVIRVTRLPRLRENGNFSKLCSFRVDMTVNCRRENGRKNFAFWERTPKTPPIKMWVMPNFFLCDREKFGKQSSSILKWRARNRWGPEISISRTIRHKEPLIAVILAHGALLGAFEGIRSDLKVSLKGAKCNAPPA